MKDLQSLFEEFFELADGKLEIEEKRAFLKFAYASQRQGVHSLDDEYYARLERGFDEFVADYYHTAFEWVGYAIHNTLGLTHL